MASQRIHPTAQILQEFERLYRSQTVALGFKFVLNIDEVSASESADAQRDTREGRVTVTRRLLQNPRMSDDGLRTILCHEIGHILGGAPRRNVPPEWDGPTAPDGLSFMSSEGQADYYATLVCFRQLVRGQNHKAVLTALGAGDTDSLLADKCDRAHGNKTEDALICRRAVRGAFNMLQMIKTFPIAIGAESGFIAGMTITDAYPDRQCRLDTFMAGALCRTEFVPTSASFDFDVASVNTCASDLAQRPKCWYNDGE